MGRIEDKEELYPNNLKSWEFDKKGLQNFCSERETIAERQGWSEGENFEANPTPSKPNFSSCLGIPYAGISEVIIGCCFEIIKELGAGFLENVYKNALFIAMKQKGLKVLAEQPFDVMFRNNRVGKYVADLVVENVVIVELKCCTALLPEHKAQVINYLKASGMPVGLLVNFGQRKLEYKRLRHPDQLDRAEKLKQELHFLISSNEQS